VGCRWWLRGTWRSDQRVSSSTAPPPPVDVEQLVPLLKRWESQLAREQTHHVINNKVKTKDDTRCEER